MADGKIIIDCSLDSSNLEKSINSLSGIAKTGFTGLLKIIGTVSTALTGLAGVSVKIGSDFSSAMSKVEATSGATADEMERLTEKAKEMGKNTQFSATESAEAFNYMAMAGWDAEQMIAGIDGVMNLAAASGEDLAMVSDIVTDSLTAFGLKAEDAGHFADVLAKASSSANTNVELLGESFKYVAPVAGAMGYSVEDCSVALGLMANAGIKGSQSGTALRSILTNLADPTDEVAQAMSDLGVSLTDNNGEMKPMNQLLTEMKGGFNNLSEAQKTQYASTIAGKYGMSGLLAIMNSTDEEFQSLTNEIYNCNGAAEDMAETMNDNLGGDIKLLKSALEGLAIEFYENVENPLRDVAKAGTEAVNELTKAFESGGTTGLVKKAGELMGKAVKAMAEKIPDFFNIGVDAIGEFLKGLLGKSASKDIEIFCVEVKTAFKNMANNIKKYIKPAITIITKLMSNIDRLTSIVVGCVAAFKTYKIVNTVVTAFNTLKKATESATIAQAALNAVMNANPFILVASAIAGLITMLGTLTIFANDAVDCTYKLSSEVKELNNKTEELVEKSEETREAFNSMKEGAEESEQAINSECNNLQSLWQELQNITDENGNVLESDKARAEFILGQLNEALGTEYTMTGNQIQNYKDMCGAIDDLIEKKRALAILESQEESYSEAITTRNELLKETVDLKGHENELWDEIGTSVQKYSELKDKINDGEVIGKKDSEFMENFDTNIQHLYDDLANTQGAISDNTSKINECGEIIGNYEQNVANASQGAYDKIVDINGNIVGNYQYTKDEIGKVTEKQIEDQYNNWQTMEELQKQGVEGVTQEMVDTAKANYETYKEAGKEQGINFVEGTDEGMSELPTTMDGAMTTAIDGIKNNETGKADINLVGQDLGGLLGTGFSAGIEAGMPQAENVFNGAINNTITKGNTTAGTSTTVGDTLITATQAGILAGTGNLNTTVENTITGAKKKGETGAREFSSVGSNISGNTAQGVSDNGSGIGTNLASAVALAKGVDLSGFLSVGNGIINGIKAGIDAVSATLTAKMQTIASGALSAAKLALGIHSPSRVFRDIVGKNIIRGIGVGLEKEYPSLEKDLTNMMENLTDLDMNDIMTTLHCSVDTNVAKSAIQNMVGYNSQSQNTINLTNSLDGNIEVVLQADGRVLARTVAPYQKEFTNYSVGRK